MAGMIQDRKENRELPVKLTEDQLLKVARKMVEVEDKIGGFTTKKKDSADYYKGLIDVEAKKVRDYASMIRSGEMYKDISCTVYFVQEGMKVETIRDDTGEVVESRPMTDHEKQLDMFNE